MASPNAPRWSRPPVAQEGPNRRAQNIYRTAEGPGRTTGGATLGRTEDAVVAAVRMAYDVANAQIDRSARLAARLRTAGDRAVGPGSDRQAVDAAERLVFRAFMAGLGWIEALASEQESPLRRLAGAQYRLLGRLLRLVGPDAPAPQGRSGTEARGGATEARSRPAETAERRPAGAAQVRIVHKADPEDRRAARIRGYEVDARIVDPTPIVFFGHGRDDLRVKATFVKDEAGPRLELLATADLPPGPYVAAICDASGVQLGWIEIQL